MPCLRRYDDSSKPSSSRPRGRLISATTSTIAPWGGARPRGRSRRARSSGASSPKLSTRTGTRTANGPKRAEPVTSSRARATRPTSSTRTLRSSAASRRLPAHQPARRTAAASTTARRSRTTSAAAASNAASSAIPIPRTSCASDAASPAQRAAANKCGAGIRPRRFRDRPASGVPPSERDLSRALRPARRRTRRLRARLDSRESSAR
jgi:hypothetical protein